MLRVNTIKLPDIAATIIRGAIRWIGWLGPSEKCCKVVGTAPGAGGNKARVAVYNDEIDIINRFVIGLIMNMDLPSSSVPSISSVGSVAQVLTCMHFARPAPTIVSQSTHLGLVAARSDRCLGGVHFVGDRTFISVAIK